ncbi:Right handed beta helix region [Pedobacter steynii]|uniref:Right handed beta helix region n=1 Tax=Pedobacter steynii TaxID=430522 RepID=A0A1H0KZH7_9SPHI|nr:right-handed parallel beta-helix repeat-containing protein [Pedobacter steynii]SDO61183.1 Right handed beta helix region [Pedobacter steynii]
MKTTSNYLLRAMLFVVSCSFACKRDSSLQEMNAAPAKALKTAAVASVADHVIETGMSLSQINAVIAGANPGETVLVQPGTYSVTGKIVMKAGVSIAKQTSTNPIFDASALSTILTMSYTSDMSNCLVSGITFWNIRFSMIGAGSTSFKYCIFDYGKRALNTNKTNNLKDAYLEFRDADLSLVSNCVFCHRVADPGRGVWLKNTTNSKIMNNTFGNGGTTGYFVTAINDNSQSNSLIDGNTITRNPALSLVDSLTDHGIYAHSFNGLTISNNTVSGWPVNGSGGSIKARNGQNLNISGNTLNDSGILLYEYANSPSFPYLKYVVVANNTINIPAAAADMYHGIGYYRDNTIHSEYSINISDNLLPNGTIYAAGSAINVADFNAAGGGVYHNDTATGYLLLKTGISNSGNY